MWREILQEVWYFSACRLRWMYGQLSQGWQRKHCQVSLQTRYVPILFEISLLRSMTVYMLIYVEDVYMSDCEALICMTFLMQPCSVAANIAVNKTKLTEAGFPRPFWLSVSQNSQEWSPRLFLDAQGQNEPKGFCRGRFCLYATLDYQSLNVSIAFWYVPHVYNLVLTVQWVWVTWVHVNTVLRAQYYSNGQSKPGVAESGDPHIRRCEAGSCVAVELHAWRSRPREQKRILICGFSERIKRLLLWPKLTEKITLQCKQNETQCKY